MEAWRIRLSRVDQKTNLYICDEVGSYGVLEIPFGRRLIEFAHLDEMEFL